MGLLITFLLGIGNFALHRAVLESRHPILDIWHLSKRSPLGRLSLAFEFVLLLTAMLLVSSGRTGWGIVYALYSVMNAVVAWAVLSRRI